MPAASNAMEIFAHLFLKEACVAILLNLKPSSLLTFFFTFIDLHNLAPNSFYIISLPTLHSSGKWTFLLFFTYTTFHLHAFVLNVPHTGKPYFCLLETVVTITFYMKPFLIL